MTPQEPKARFSRLALRGLDPQALSPEACFHQLPHVLSARCADVIVLMDQRHETFHTLNDVGGRIWDLLGLGTPIVAIADALAREYDAPRERLEVDLRQTVGHLLSQQLIAAGSRTEVSDDGSALPTPAPRERQVSGHVAPRSPSVLWCGILLVWFKLLLQFRGPHAALLWSDHRVAGKHLSEAASLEAVRQVEYPVALAAALFPGRARCLEQSLVLYHILRQSGVSARFLLGAQPVPFMAHAWVEYRGEPINDLAEHVKWFVRFQACTS